MNLFHTGKTCPQCGETTRRTVACPWCQRPVNIEEKPKEFVERAIQQIWFAGGLIAMMAVCIVGFGIASFLVCLPFAFLWWLLNHFGAFWFCIALTALVMILWFIGFIRYRGKTVR